MSAIQKADRLVSEGKAEAIPARVFRVEGDHDTYLVTIAPDHDLRSCTCPAYGGCSHLLAAAMSLMMPAPTEGEA